jgi:uncharacterized protein (UPF0276 family)
MFPHADCTAAAVPARAGACLKPVHVPAILADGPDVGFFEVHAENYMGAGGPPHADLSRIRARYPLSVHGVGLSIGGAGPLDEAHLERLKAVVERYEPGLVSEHLAWSSHGGRYFPDLLPLATNAATLDLVCDHIDRVQDVLRRQILLENPSSYLAFEASTIPEPDFLAEIARRTGCGLLLDVNNVMVSAVNLGFSPEDYLREFPLFAVAEIHLAGHAPDRDETGAPLLIDAHDRRVAEAVWTLYRQVLARTGPLPTLIEWDADLPPLETLLAECAAAETWLAAAPAAAPGGLSADTARRLPELPAQAPAEAQARFAEAVVDPQRPVPGGIASSQRRFDVYRNNVAVAAIDALAETFPAVEDLVGTEFFRAMARVFLGLSPPKKAVLAEYGAGLPDFLEDFPPAASVPYLADVARIESARIHAYHAADAPVLAIDALAQLPEASIADARLIPHPSLCIVSSRYPAGSLWAAASGEAEDGPQDMTKPEAVLILRAGSTVETRILPPGGEVFLRRLIQGASIGEAAAAATKAGDSFALEDHLAGLFAAGAFSALTARQPAPA